MTLALAQLVLLSMACFAAVGAAATATVYPRLRARLATCAPAEQARWTFLWIALPAILALALTAVCVLPSVGSLVEASERDHCLSHADDHLHLCLVHPPTGAGSLLGWVTLAAVGLLGAVSSSRIVRSLVTARRALTVFLEDAREDRPLRVTWVRCALPVAATVGLLRPRILISASLREALPPDLLDAVIAHERAHVRRSDVARRTAATLLGLLHLPAVRKLLLDDLVMATELGADASAADAVPGGALCVADAILAVERLAGEVRPAALAVAFGEIGVAARIEALLAPATQERRWDRVTAAVAVVVLALSSAPLLHHAIETALSLVVG